MLQFDELVFQGKLRCTGQPAQPEDRLGRTRIIFAGQPGQQVQANARPGPGKIGVAGILTKRLPELFQAGAELLPGDREEWADEADRRVPAQDAPRRHAGKPAQAGAADDAVEDGLGLVIPRVPDRDGRSAARRRNFQ